MSRKTTKEEALALNKKIDSIYGITDDMLGERGDVYAPSHANPMTKQDDAKDSYLREQVNSRLFADDFPILNDIEKDAVDNLVALIKEQERQARIDELKALEPPEQFADYNRIMGSEFCRICGFNSEVFRKHINDRISQLEQEGKK